MISSFGDKATEALFHARSGEPTRRFPPDVVKTALRKLDLLNAARNLRTWHRQPETAWKP